MTEKSKLLHDPKVTFLKEPVQVVHGRKYGIHLQYDYGCDTLDARIAVREHCNRI